MNTYEALLQKANDVLVELGMCEEGQRLPKIEAMFVDGFLQVQREREYAL
jgi:hypothetical protein